MAETQMVNIPARLRIAAARRRVALQAVPTLRPALAIRPNMDRTPPSTEILGSDGMVNLGIGVAVFGRR